MEPGTLLHFQTTHSLVVCGQGQQRCVWFFKKCDLAVAFSKINTGERCSLQLPGVWLRGLAPTLPSQWEKRLIAYGWKSLNSGLAHESLTIFTGYEAWVLPVCAPPHLKHTSPGPGSLRFRTESHLLHLFPDQMYGRQPPLQISPSVPCRPGSFTIPC